jgi:DNA-binding NarL/FixJ family response regulator
MIRVLLADDQALVRGGFRLILDAEPDIEVVAEAADGDQAVASALETRPDLVLMDIRMPVLDGIQATRRLVPQLGATRVLMLTTFDLDDYVVDAFRAGASGFLLKTAPPPQLVAAIRTVHAGDGLLAPASTRRLIEQFARPPVPGPMLGTLTARESDVLLLLARGLSNAEIAAQLVVEPSTIKSHVASLLAKLSLRDRVQAVVFAYENGLIRPGERPARLSWQRLSSTRGFLLRSRRLFAHGVFLRTASFCARRLLRRASLAQGVFCTRRLLPGSRSS